MCAISGDLPELLYHLSGGLPAFVYPLSGGLPERKRCHILPGRRNGRLRRDRAQQRLLKIALLNEGAIPIKIKNYIAEVNQDGKHCEQNAEFFWI